MRAARAGGSPWEALHHLKIGCVQYLNALPLIHAYDGDVVFDHPSALARELAAGRLDAALVPSFELLRDPVYDIVDGIAVASDGPVHSVVLAYRGEVRDITSVALDPASMTSAHLLRVLLAEFYGIHPAYRIDGDARLLIGNQAILCRALEEANDPELRWLDLGEEWRERTGRPFVYAAWALRPELGASSDVADAFRGLKEQGMQCRELLIGPDVKASSSNPLHDPAFRRRYLTEHIRYDLNTAEKEGLARYRELLAKWRLIPVALPPLQFV